MRLIHSLVLLSVGSLALILSPVAARAASIPTLTATSVTYFLQPGLTNWSVNGDSFSVGYRIAASGNPGFETDGQAFSGSNIDALFEYILNTGFLTLDNVTHRVELVNLPSFFFPPGFIYRHSVTGTNPDGSRAIVAAVPTVIASGSGPNSNSFSELQEIFCDIPSKPVCRGNVLANVSIDVPGVTALYGFQSPGDSFDTITSVIFTTTPEPLSGMLSAAGLFAILGLMTFRPRLFFMGK